MTVLDEAYQRLHGMGPEFGGDEEGNHGLTNHGPMAAEVILRRGLDLDVHKWLDGYTGRLAELPDASNRITAENWQEALGGGARRIGDWTTFFTREIASTPWQAVLNEWWPRLLPGIAAGSTHGVIRVGHAVRALQAEPDDAVAAKEMGYGLAFWAARSRPLPGVTAPAGTSAAAAALAAVPRLAEQSGFIAHRLDRLADLDGWPGALAALTPPESTTDVPAKLADLVHAGVVRYLTHGYGSPVLLVHCATAPNAVLHVLPVLAEDQWIPSFTAAWAASAAITATYGPAEPAPRDTLPQATSTAETLDRAAHHGDEHVIKFADTAVEAFDRTGDPDTLAAAVQASKLIG